MNILFLRVNSCVKAAARVLQRLLGGFCAALLSLLVLDVLWGVLTRYMLGSQADFTEECARMLLIWLTFFGGAYAFGKNAHIGLDFLVLKFSPAPRKTARVLAAVMTLVFALAILFAGGVMFVITAKNSDTSLVCLPSVKLWWIYMCLPASGIIAALFALENIMDTLFADTKECCKEDTQI